MCVRTRARAFLFYRAVSASACTLCALPLCNCSVFVTFLFAVMLFTVDDDDLSVVGTEFVELVTKTLTKIRSSRTCFFFVYLLFGCSLHAGCCFWVHERPFSIFV